MKRMLRIGELAKLSGVTALVSVVPSAVTGRAAGDHQNHESDIARCHDRSQSGNQQGYVAHCWSVLGGLSLKLKVDQPDGMG